MTIRFDVKAGSIAKQWQQLSTHLWELTLACVHGLMLLTDDLPSCFPGPQFPSSEIHCQPWEWKLQLIL